MHLNGASSNEELAEALTSVGLLAKEQGTANAVHRYLRMHRLLRDAHQKTAAEKRELRQMYLSEVKLFEAQIRQIRLLKRIEMARSRNWDFSSYLQGAWTILACRTTFRAAYWGHALGVQGVSRWVERSGYRAFNAIFFDLGGLPQLA